MGLIEPYTENWGLPLTPSSLFCRKPGVNGGTQRKTIVNPQMLVSFTPCPSKMQLACRRRRPQRGRRTIRRLAANCRKHSTDVHSARLQGEHPPVPYAACGRKLNPEHSPGTAQAGKSPSACPFEVPCEPYRQAWANTPYKDTSARDWAHI